VLCEGISSGTTLDIHELEDYFLNFPTDVLNYDSLNFTYEAEAMIWFHGIYIVQCKSVELHNRFTLTEEDMGRDLTDILFGGASTSTRFSTALEHSLLLSEVRILFSSNIILTLAELRKITFRQSRRSSD
jgi:hypothetical protein